MIEGLSKLPENVIKLFCAPDKESFELAMTICRSQYPAIWSAMLNYTGLATYDAISKRFIVPESALKIVSNQKEYIDIGHTVRYRGMANCPDMVVTSVSLTVVGDYNIKIAPARYITKLECKYYNKSSQSFMTVIDRLECFEIIKPKNYES